jgi:hypothetical protein
MGMSRPGVPGTGSYKYTRGYAHYGYPYYDHRARYSRPYGYGFGYGYRGGRDCW